MAQSTDFSNTHLVQYAIDSNGNIDPKWSRPLQHIQNKLVPGLRFWGVTASKYGIRKIKGATHVGLFDLSRDDAEAQLLSFEIPQGPVRREVFPIQGHFLVLRASKHYMKIAISEHKSYNSAKKALEENS